MPNTKEDLDLRVKKSGLHLVVHKFDQNKCITKEDINQFLIDADLPEKPQEQLTQEIISCGGNANGFRKLVNFFIFLIRNLKSATTKESMSAFGVFDLDDTGFIDMMVMSNIVTNMGDKMEEKDINSLLTVLEIDNHGALNYDEALRTSLNRVMEKEISEMGK